MHFPIFFAARQPLPKPFVAGICIVGTLGLIVQTIYAYRKGGIYFGHPDGGIGPGSWGPPYNKICRDTDPKKFWRVFYLNVALTFAFFVGSVAVFNFYP